MDSGFVSSWFQVRTDCVSVKSLADFGSDFSCWLLNTIHVILGMVAGCSEFRFLARVVHGQIYVGLLGVIDFFGKRKKKKKTSLFCFTVSQVFQAEPILASS